MHHAFGILHIDTRKISRIALFQFTEEHRKSFLFQSLIELGAHRFGDGGQRIDAATKGIDIHHAPSAHHKRIVVGKMALTHLQGFFFKACGTIIVGQCKIAHEVMRHACQLCGSWCGSTDGQVGKHLARIGTNDGTMQELSHLQAEFCFSYGSRSCEYKKFRTRHDH